MIADNKTLSELTYQRAAVEMSYYLQEEKKKKEFDQHFSNYIKCWSDKYKCVCVCACLCVPLVTSSVMVWLNRGVTEPMSHSWDKSLSEHMPLI